MYHTVGNKYEETKDLDIKEIAKLVRAEIKKQFPSIKTSVRISRYSGGRSLDVNVTESPAPLNNPEYDPDFVWGIRVGKIVSWASADEIKRRYMTEEGERVKKGIEQIVAAYNYDDSDSMTDYFHVRFYSHVTIAC